VVGIEAHPRTYRCLEKLLPYNRLENVILNLPGGDGNLGDCNY
jgi:hypothetical protein